MRRVDKKYNMQSANVLAEKRYIESKDIVLEFNILDEIIVQHKTEFGKGTEHTIYPSQKNPDRLYKTGKKDNILKWSAVFKANPNLFPTIYNIAPLSNKIDYYVEIEKLNTKKVLSEWDYLEMILEEIGYVDTDGLGGNDIDSLFMKVVVKQTYYNKVKLALSEENIGACNLFVKWVTFLKEVKSFIAKHSYSALDIHRYNFGYDNNGNIKAIDI